MSISVDSDSWARMPELEACSVLLLVYFGFIRDAASGTQHCNVHTRRTDYLFR